MLCVGGVSFMKGTLFSSDMDSLGQLFIQQGFGFPLFCLFSIESGCSWDSERAISQPTKAAEHAQFYFLAL